MAKSRSESHCEALRGKEQCLARAEALIDVVRGFSLVQNKEHDPEGWHYRLGQWAA